MKFIKNKQCNPADAEAYYNYRYFLPYSPEWGNQELCDTRLRELLSFCENARIDAVQFYVNTLPGTYYMPAHNAEEQQHWAKWMKKTVVPELRDIGVSYQLNFQMLLGGSPYGLDMRDEYEWDFLVNQYGEESPGCACPLSEKFRLIGGEMLKLWASTKPDVIWLDDDLRMHNHGTQTPAGDSDFYCYCNTHLEAFADFCGKRYSREELLAKILVPGEPDKTRLQWLDFLGQSMVDTAEWINRCIQGVSPETRIALMTSRPATHAAEGRKWKEMLTVLSGKYPPITRPLCGIYNGSNAAPKRHTLSCRYMMQSMHSLEDLFGINKVHFGPELENTRFTTWSNSVAGTKYILTLGQLLGAPEITLSLNDLDSSPINHEPTIMPMLRDSKSMLSQLASLKLNAWQKEGIALLNDDDSARKLLLPEKAKMLDLAPARQWDDLLLQCGIPVYYASPESASKSTTDIVALEACTAWLPSDEEIKKLLAGKLLLDADAAFVLQQRGFGKYIGIKAGEKQPFGVMSEIYLKNSINIPQQRIPHRGFNWRQVECQDCELISEFIDAKNRRHPGSMIFTNELGGRVAVYNSVGDLSPLGNFGDHARLKWLHGIINWLSEDNFIVLPKLFQQGLCLVRTLNNDLLIALANLGYDNLHEVKFKINKILDIKEINMLNDSGEWQDINFCIEEKQKLSVKCKLNVFDWIIIKVAYCIKPELNKKYKNQK